MSPIKSEPSRSYRNRLASTPLYPVFGVEASEAETNFLNFLSLSFSHVPFEIMDREMTNAGVSHANKPRPISGCVQLFLGN